MDDFTETYHLAVDDHAAAVSLLERVGRPGWAYGASGGWVTMTLDGEFAGTPDPDLVDANDGLLVFTVIAPPQGWQLAIFDGDTLCAKYLCSWEGDLHVEADLFDLDEVVDLLLQRNPSLEIDRNEFVRLLDVDTLDDVRFPDGTNTGHRVAAMLGFTIPDGPPLLAPPPEHTAVRVDAASTSGPAS